MHCTNLLLTFLLNGAEYVVICEKLHCFVVGLRELGCSAVDIVRTTSAPTYSRAARTLGIHSAVSIAQYALWKLWNIYVWYSMDKRHPAIKFPWCNPERVFLWTAGFAVCVGEDVDVSVLAELFRNMWKWLLVHLFLYCVLCHVSTSARWQLRSVENLSVLPSDRRNRLGRATACSVCVASHCRPK